jgi:hypothetical protein
MLDNAPQSESELSDPDINDQDYEPPSKRRQVTRTHVEAIVPSTNSMQTSGATQQSHLDKLVIDAAEILRSKILSETPTIFEGLKAALNESSQQTYVAAQRIVKL